MSANKFVKFFESSTNEISFEDFFKLDFFTNSTPEKSVIKYSGETKSVMKQIRNAIFSNLRINEFFTKRPLYENQDIGPFYQLIRDTTNDFNDNQKAQLILLLHLSKSNADMDIFRTFFHSTCTIKITNGMDQFNQEAKTLFSRLLENDRIQMIIKDVVKEISGSNSNGEFNSIKFTYYRSNIVGLKGFAGINKIYISVNELDRKIGELNDNNLSKKIDLFKLKFTALVLHECTHVILRSSLDDFNISSPKVLEENKNAKKDRSSYVEAGILSVKKLFNAVIDWDESAEKGFNLDYCSEFLEKFLNNEQVEFDLNKADVVISTRVPLLMAVDYSPVEIDCF